MAISRSPEYKAWYAAKHRCTNPNNKYWNHYGGRGIKMCPEWQENFAAFLAHIGPKPHPKLTLDRIDNDKGYEPGNVQWATMSHQHLNKRPSNRRYDLSGLKFGRLTAIEPLPRIAKRCTKWRCVCDCGTIIVTDIGKLRNGHTRSCGCLHRDMMLSRWRGTTPDWERRRTVTRCPVPAWDDPNRLIPTASPPPTPVPPTD